MSVSLKTNKNPTLCMLCVVQDSQSWTQQGEVRPALINPHYFGRTACFATSVPFYSFVWWAQPGISWLNTSKKCCKAPAEVLPQGTSNCCWAPEFRISIQLPYSVWLPALLTTGGASGPSVADLNVHPVVGTSSAEHNLPCRLARSQLKVDMDPAPGW